MAKKKDTLVPYDQVSPGFEAAYTGENKNLKKVVITIILCYVQKFNF